MDNSPFNRSSLTVRSPPSTPQPQELPQQPPLQQPPQPQPTDHAIEAITTPELQQWLSAMENHLGEVCQIAMDGKLNSDQKLKITNHCRKVILNVSQLVIQYQSLKLKAVVATNTVQSLNEEQALSMSLREVKQAIQEIYPAQQPKESFADMVKKGTNDFIRPAKLNSVAIYSKDKLKTGEQVKTLVQKIISPSDNKLQIRGLRKITDGVIISTETKNDVENIKKTVEKTSPDLVVGEPKKRRPRIIVFGVPVTMSESDVFKNIYDQNIADKIPTISREEFLASVKLSHLSGRRGAESRNFIIEVPPNIRKALITKERVFLDWTSCTVRDFTFVTRCYKCHQYGHSAKTCKDSVMTCGHCGESGHKMNDCTKKGEAPKCATCIKYKKPSDHKTGDTNCPAKKNAEYRYINSIDYEGA